MKLIGWKAQPMEIPEIEEYQPLKPSTEWPVLYTYRHESGILVKVLKAAHSIDGNFRQTVRPKRSIGGVMTFVSSFT